MTLRDQSDIKGWPRFTLEWALMRPGYFASLRFPG
jgi:hypothetical protein